ncbi:MAG: hypothetical protein ACW96N_08180 [Candidatus Thorarchaeota archaeon]|jgi:hypothetical protein
MCSKEPFQKIHKKPSDTFDLLEGEKIYRYGRFRECRGLPIIKAGDLLFYSDEYYLVLEEPIGLIVSDEDDGTFTSDTDAIRFSRTRWAYPGIAWELKMIDSSGSRLTTVLSEHKILNEIRILSRDDDELS